MQLLKATLVNILAWIVTLVAVVYTVAWMTLLLALVTGPFLLLAFVGIAHFCYVRPEPCAPASIPAPPWTSNPAAFGLAGMVPTISWSESPPSCTNGSLVRHFAARRVGGYVR
jgi:hypothetical protein